MTDRITLARTILDERDTKGGHYTRKALNDPAKCERARLDLAAEVISRERHAARLAMMAGIRRLNERAA